MFVKNLGQFSFVLLIVILVNKGQHAWSFEVQRNPGKNINTNLKFMIYTIRDIIRRYEIEHLIMGKGWIIPDRKNLAWTCKLKTRKENLPITAQANEIIKILQKFAGELQQMQVDEANLPRPSYEITRSIRFLEYDLRDLAEMRFRRFIKKKIGQPNVPYSVGSLPKRMSCCKPKHIRAMHVYKLQMLLSCISDIRHVTRKQWSYLSKDTNNTKDILGKV